ncbi:MAG TPA: hypothetical protein VKG45_07375 [Actinomycetes bacterium]|nr:hypothetical protein [Actinomycetes bacterium]
MRLPRRRAPDADVQAAWEHFARFARALDEGSRALLASVPTARRQGVPVQAAVAGFLAGLEAARAELPGWALPALSAEAEAAAAALAAAEARARRLPAATRDLEFEHRNQLVGEVLDELDGVRRAEAAVRALRRGRRAPR